MRVKVKDVMTRDVASVHADTPFKDVAELLISRGISAVPVVDDAGHVVGVVSEADLLHKEEFREQYYQEGYQPPLRARLRRRLSEEGGVTTAERKARGEVAGELMTTPAVTVTPTTTMTTAVRRMEEHGVKRLPVVDEAGRLVGIVSRRDLIKVFLRPDEEIQQRVREALQGKAEVSVSDGVVTLTGTFPERSQAVIAVHLAENVDGVVAVRDKLSWKHDDVADVPIWGGA